MINHIVFLKFRTDISDSAINTVLNQLGDLRKHIPTIKDFSFGKNCSPEHLNQGFSYAFIMKFKNADDRDFYLNHPEHQKIALDHILPILENGFESVLVIDYEDR